MTEKHSTVSPARRPLLFIAILVGLSACAGTSPVSFPPVIGSGTEAPERERKPEADEPRPYREEVSQPGPRPGRALPDNNADFYIEAADQADGSERDALLLRAAESAHFEGDDKRALEIFEDIPVSQLPNEQYRRAILLLAELGQYADRPLTLLSQLQPPDSTIPHDIAQRIWTVRANAHLTLGQTLEAIDALVQVERHLVSESEKRAQHEKIWRTLRSAPPLDISPQGLASYNTDTRGWAELADVMLDLWLGPQELRAAIRDWEQNYPAHPANHTVLTKEIRSIPEPGPLQVFVPDRKFDTIALLLPLTGPYAAPASAVRDGFMTAHYRRQGQDEKRPEILVFDTGNPNDSIERQTEQAILSGADIIVGPLEKDKVARLAQNLDAPVPILALNYLESTPHDLNSFYQFGLSPEDEAAQVAERSLADGRLNALALVPQTDWGRRILQAFQQSLHGKGGRLLDYEFYDPDQADFRAPITRLLKYSVQQKEKERVVTIRQDMDYIFLAAQPQQARLIRPQLRFFRATRVPVYATSHVYSGRHNIRLDQDLDGIRFGDMPWILDHGEDLRDARETAKKLWPDSYARLPRLYAMGFDAYALATQIARNNLREGLGYPAASGVLTLQQGGRISRGLVWAHFSGGLPHLLADKPPVEEQPEEEVEEELEEEGYLPEELAR